MSTQSLRTWGSITPGHPEHGLTPGMVTTTGGQLAADGVLAGVASLPSAEWFENEDESCRSEVLPAAIRARAPVETGITSPWCLFTGEVGVSIGVDHFGASADYKTIYREFGITAERVAAAARDSLARA